MLLVAGLGNPGAEYARHRHNIGFMAADAIHARHGFSPWRKRFQAEVAEGHVGGVKCLLIKPQTYMNESGRAVGEAMRFYKLEPEDVLVIHDELDLTPGKARVKSGGGHGGNNGVRSISAHIGADYRRLRLGIGHPGRKDAVSGYVLHDFSKAERQWAEPLIEAVADNFALLATGDDANFMNRLALALRGDPAPERPNQRGRKKPVSEESGAPDKPAEERTGPFAALRKLIGGE